MMTYLKIKSEKPEALMDITEKLQRSVPESHFTNGICVVFGATTPPRWESTRSTENPGAFWFTDTMT